MTLPYPISATQVDKKSPVDEQLMQAIKADLDYLDAAQQNVKTYEYAFKCNGNLAILPERLYKRIDGVVVMRETTITTCRLFLEEPGDSGSLEVDILKITKPNTLITSLTRLYSGTINAIARTGSSINTQSVTRSTSQIATQSITQWKSSINISSIVVLGDSLVRYNLASQPDSDWQVGDSVTFASASSGANNGTFVIVKVNDDNGNNVVITNASGLDQSSAAGTAALQAYSYNYSNPVSSEFAAGESALFASHSTGANNGTLAIYAINQGGNNIIVKNPTGATQGGIAGNANTNRWVFAMSTAAPSDYVVGEKAHLVGHTSGSNDGEFPITAVNSGGNNIICYNASGVTQGGAAGTIDTNRWTYTLATDPSADIAATEHVYISDAASALNDGDFEAKQINRGGGNNIVVYNVLGVVGGAFGTLVSTLTKATFASDQSASITTASEIELFGTLADDTYDVSAVNRGGGANYNAVIDIRSSIAQVGAGGRVISEGKSIFSTKPILTLATSTVNSTNRHFQVATNGVFNSLAILSTGDMLAVNILQIPTGSPKTMLVQIF